MQISNFLKNLLTTIIFLFMLTNSQAQNVGIGTSQPKARLHVTDSSVLFSAPFTLPVVALPTPVTGAGTRLMWFAPKAAIRAGGVSGIQWDETNIGQYSTAFGRNTIASGQYSTSLGVGSTVTGNVGATALGSNNVVSGSTATGIGFAVNAQAYNSLVVGRYNAIAGNPTSWVPGDPLFVVGNGSSGAAPNNAFVIKKNGDAYFDANTTTNGNAIISGTTSMNSDANALGTTSLFGPTNIYNTVTVKNNKEIIAEKSAGTAPLINLVPLGVIKFKIVYDRGGVFDDCNITWTNLAGNFVVSASSSCGDPTGFPSFVEGKMVFNAAQASVYQEVIAVPNLTYDNKSSTFDESFNHIFSYVTKTAVTLKPEAYGVGFKCANISAFAVPRIEGTVMFYGLK